MGITFTPALSLGREREPPGSSAESIAATKVLGNCQVPVTSQVTGTSKALTVAISCGIV